MDDIPKKQAEDILGELGVNITTAITMFALKQSIEKYESSRSTPLKKVMVELERMSG